MKIYDFNGKKNISGLRIREARITRGLTQSALAAKLQTYNVILDQDSISRIESGNRFVTDYELRTLAEILQVDLSWLIGQNR